MTDVELHDVAVYQCPRCESKREAHPDRPAPTCGALHSEFSRQEYPDGGWTRITTEHFEPHGEMKLVETKAGGNPLVDFTNELEAELAARREKLGRTRG